MLVPRWVFLFACLLAEWPLAAQIPLPHRNKPKVEKAAGDTIEVMGILRSVDAKLVVLEAQDTRILSLKRTETTKFLKNSTETEASSFRPGDHLTVETTRDEQGYLYAVEVIWTKAGTSEERARASQPVEISEQTVPDADKDAPPVQHRGDSAHQDAPESDADAVAPLQPGAEPPRTEVRDAAPPVRMGADDPGPPVQHHGAPAARRSAPIEPPTELTPTEIASAAVPQPSAAATAPPPTPRPDDPIVEKARQAAAAFDERLPNYVCQQFTARFESTSHPVNWRAIDIVSAEVIFEDQSEHYRNIKINDKPTNKRLEDTGGAWSRGEYGTILASLFSPGTAAEFHKRGGDTIAGVSTAVYDYSVERERSNWSIQAPSQLLRPAYRGAVWIDPKSGRVLRIEMQARRMPEEFPLDTVETAIEYQYIRLGGPDLFLLPVHAEILSCQRGTSNCSRNAIDFRNYHRYSGESSITFGK
jgi:hypothetical protein